MREQSPFEAHAASSSLSEVEQHLAEATLARKKSIEERQRASKVLAAAKRKAKRVDQAWLEASERRRRFYIQLLRNGWTRQAIAAVVGMSVGRVQAIVPQYLDIECSCGHLGFFHFDDPNDARRGKADCSECNCAHFDSWEQR